VYLQILLVDFCILNHSAFKLRPHPVFQKKKKHTHTHTKKGQCLGNLTCLFSDTKVGKPPTTQHSNSETLDNGPNCVGTSSHLFN
jgi:hypothetical protein